ncbi:hypothetical protein F0562_015810 [Nyssa sinensis]|uniref:Knottin scorpion toxin-like domain-containing protein n=1 Tax=Nyssa sinensis TaxID=561372 RepID=A0A5J4ZM61_9ASTE|nr:hypothetical protein F0562_015810 [Nyssa sinensis]
MKMKMSCTLPPLLLLLIVSSVEFTAASAVHEAHAIRIPEHTCRKLIGSGKCNWQKCIQDCFKEPNGVGKCKGSICICTYYCKQPPQ